MKSARRLMLPGWIALAACVATGCSRLPMDPTSEIATDVPEASAPTSIARGVEPAGQKPAPPDPGAGNSSRVVGSLGGSVHGGQFRVIIPAGAFKGQATITVSQPDPSVPRVDLSIWPAVKNNFDVPVILVAELPTATTTQLSGSRVHELNPTSGSWTPMSGQSADLAARTVQVALVHFSSYKVEVPPVPNPSTGEPRGRRF